METIHHRLPFSKAHHSVLFFNIFVFSYLPGSHWFPFSYGTKKLNTQRLEVSYVCFYYCITLLELQTYGFHFSEMCVRLFMISETYKNCWMQLLSSDVSKLWGLGVSDKHIVTR